MIRQVLIAVVLTGALSLLGWTQMALAEDEPEIANIGFVLYTKSRAPGTLNARWIYTDKYSGPEIATGGPADGYAGEYHDRYFYESGEFSDEYDLVIEKDGDIYRAYWLVDGKTLAVGVGMSTESGLAVGWRRVTN